LAAEEKWGSIAHDLARHVLPSYLVVLLLLPVVVRWRWGLPAALGMTLAEVALLVLVFYLLHEFRVFPDDLADEPAPQASIDIVRRWRSSADSAPAGDTGR
jgi:hypothetical protein